MIDSCFLALAVAALYSTVESLPCRTLSTSKAQNAGHQYYTNAALPFSSKKAIQLLVDDSLRSRSYDVKKSSTALLMSEFGEAVEEASRLSVDTQNLYRPLKTMGKTFLNRLLVIFPIFIYSSGICNTDCFCHAHVLLWSLSYFLRQNLWLEGLF